MHKKRESFGSKLGILASAVGSAVGLGNIWRFSYIVGDNGGGAFILVYFICIIFIGLPIMLAEFSLGRNAKGNCVHAFKTIEPNRKKPWFIGGYLSVLIAFLILSYYGMLAGWLLSYFGRSITGKLANVSSYSSVFNNLVANPWENIITTFIIFLITAIICYGGIKSGIEKVSKILMPILFVFLIGLIINSAFLKGSSKGYEFLFRPDFKSLSWSGVFKALGHSFYSMSLGMGIIITYGSYTPKKENLKTLSVKISIADTIVALMAGMVIFPAIFAFGETPSQGAGMLFITMPAIFNKMAFSTFFSATFFCLVLIAAITSTISLMEVIVTFCMEQFKLKRHQSVILISIALFLISLLSIFSFSVLKDFKLFSLNVFEAIDYITSNILLPISGIIIAVFVGHKWGIKKMQKELSSDGLFRNTRGMNLFLRTTIKYLAPLGILLIFLVQTEIVKL